MVLEILKRRFECPFDNTDHSFSRGRPRRIEWSSVPSNVGLVSWSTQPERRHNRQYRPARRHVRQCGPERRHRGHRRATCLDGLRLRQLPPLAPRPQAHLRRAAIRALRRAWVAERAAHACPHDRMHTHTHTRARMHTHTHTHMHMYTHGPARTHRTHRTCAPLLHVRKAAMLVGQYSIRSAKFASCCKRGYV